MFDLSVATMFSGAQPLLVFSVKSAMGRGFTQIFNVTSSPPQACVALVFSLIKYVPGCENRKESEVVPFVHKEGSVKPKSLPNEPLVNVQPVNGLIDHIPLPGVQTPLEETPNPLPLRFVTVRVVLVQMIVSGEKPMTAFVFSET